MIPSAPAPRPLRMQNGTAAFDITDAATGELLGAIPLVAPPVTVPAPEPDTLAWARFQVQEVIGDLPFVSYVSAAGRESVRRVTGWRVAAAVLLLWPLAMSPLAPRRSCGTAPKAAAPPPRAMRPRGNTSSSPRVGT